MTRFLRDEKGTTTVEYLVVTALVVGVLGVALTGLFLALSGRIAAVNESL